MTEVEFSTKILFKDNTIKQIPSSSTTENVLFIRADMVGHRLVHVSLKPIDFSRQKIQKVLVSMHYEDVAAGLSCADEFTFLGQDGRDTFEFDYVSTERDRYRCVVNTLFSNGMSKTTELGLLSDKHLILDLA